MQRRLPCRFVFCAATLLAYIVPAPAQSQQQSQPSSATMVNALNGVFGAHSTFRANHAHGTLLTATFTPAPGAAIISRAPHFAVAATPVLVRFSTFGGIPDIPDAAPGAAPYGLSLKFMLAGDRETDLVMHSFNGFPSATAADFVDFLTAMGNSPAGAARPTPLERYADLHPPAKAYLAALKPAPSSFITQPYFGVNTFKFTNAAGEISHGRYRMVPLGTAQYISAATQASAAADYLRKQMDAQLAMGPVQMRLQLQLAGPDDVLEDPSVAWPEARELVDLGVLTIRGAADDAGMRERTVVFMPDELPDGIEAADPMIAARTRAYAESLERRLK
ncbi:MAG: Catalase-like protein [Massilia sp.]|jgi:catalase|nr:Catalase-like protein [Massilia sp.]